VIVPPALTATILYGWVAGAITAGRGATPSSEERAPFRGCAEAVSSRAQASATTLINEKPKNRRSIDVEPKWSSLDRGASDVPSYFAAYTRLPPIQVEITLVPSISVPGTCMMSRSSTTKSAYLPGVSEPRIDSWKPA